MILERKTLKFVPAPKPKIPEIPPVLGHKLELEALLIAFGKMADEQKNESDRSRMSVGRFPSSLDSK